MLTWKVSGQGIGQGGRSYLSHIDALNGDLRQQGKLACDAPDISFIQAGQPGPVGQLLTVSWSVTTPSIRLGNVLYKREVGLVLRGAANADFTLCCSEIHADAVVAAGVEHEQLIVVQLGSAVPVKARNEPPPVRHPRVGYAGQGAEFKRNWVARDAAQKAGFDFVEVDRLEFDRMADFYDGLWVLAVPSIAESWGLVASEAIARGCPVVCTNGAGCAEQVDETGAGIVVPWDNEEAFVSGVCEVTAGYKYALAAWRCRPRVVGDWVSDVITVVENLARRTT